MKKKFFAILLTASLLVGVWTAAALAAASLLINSATGDSMTINSEGHGVLTLPPSGGTATGKISISVPGGDALTADYAQVALETTDGLTAVFSNNVTDGKIVDGLTAGTGKTLGLTLTSSIKGSYTLKFRMENRSANNADFTIDVVEPQVPKFTTDTMANNMNIGQYYSSTNKVIYAGKEITSADWSEGLVLQATSTNTGSGTPLNFKADFSPATTLLYIVTEHVGSDDLRAYIVGTAPNVTVDTEYTVKLTPYDMAGDGETRTYKFNVYAKPTISTASKPGTITWGTAWNWKPSGTKVNTSGTAWEIIKTASDDDTYLTSADLASNDITFTPSTGNLATTAKGANDAVAGWRPGKGVGSILSADTWDGKDITKKIRLRAWRGTDASEDKNVYVEETFELKFKGIDPVFNPLIAAVNSSIAAKSLKYNKVLSEDDGIIIRAYGPGKIEWDSKDIPAGLTVKEVSADEDGYYSYLKIYGTPLTTTKSHAMTFTAKNGFTTKGTTFNPTITIGYDKVEFVSADIPSGDSIVVGAEFSYVIKAQPGPITSWTPSSTFPKGLTITPASITDDPLQETATISGKLTEARSGKKDTDRVYTIRATNANISKYADISADIMIYAAPKFTYDYIFNKKSTINTGEKLEYTVPVTGFPSTSWDVTIDSTPLVTNGVAQDANDNGGVAFNGGKSKIKVDMAKLASGDLVLVGSVDRVPGKAVNNKFTVTVIARNPADTVTKNYEVTVKGKAPALKKSDITFSGTGETNSKDIAVTEGDAPITMTATIDAKTAEKLFGETTAIDLTNDNVTGLRFVPSTDGKGKIYVDDTKDVAYSKLPITVTAANEDVADKAASAKYTVTFAAKNKPEWKPADDNLSSLGSALTSSDKVGTTLELKAVADSSVTAVFKATGSGPLTYTVKPASKNNLSATVDSSNGTITINGTATAPKKDVATKFTISAKNASTGDEAKSEITITAKPKPEVSETTIKTTVLFGKKVKVAPKATKTSQGMVWVLESVTGSTANDSEALAEYLNDTYGLDFDKNKGTISGTPTKATGDNNPLKITMCASSDIAKSDTVTAEITIRGEKVKLVTKKASVSIEDPENVEIKTNLPSSRTTDQANVKFTAEFSDALAGLSLEDNGTTATLTGTPASVTKKQTVEVTMNNFDTESKGKLAITVVGAIPSINPVGDAEVTAGGNTQITLTLSNQEKVSQKIKWKISTKPSGISAKVKGDADGATLTLKANRKAKSGTTTVGVTATDSVSKAISTPITINVTVTNPSDTNDTPLEAPEAPETDSKAETEAETKAEDKAEEKALGEGEVHMGAERTADKLTAAQRKAIEDEGYIIAAVLPEIEVTASGQYDFEVELDKEVAAGAELVWFAFSTKPTTDDEIVDFADEKGKETKVVPESHVVIVAPWLNAETKYAPVIAVKADAKDAEATTVEDVKEAAEAKTEE